MTRYRIKFHPRFVEELEDAITYYNEHSKRAATQFTSAVKKQLNALKANPHTRSVRYDDIRFARVEKFPYAIHYSIDTTAKQVLVQALLCDYQNPDTHWQKRF